MLAGVAAARPRCPRARCCRPPATTSLDAVAAGERARRRGCPRARPATSSTAGPSTPRSGKHRAAAPRATVDGDGVSCHRRGRLGARRARRRPARRRRRRRATARPSRCVVEASAAACDRGGHALRRDPLARARDARRRAGRRLDVDRGRSWRAAWYLAQALLAAESLGAVETALEMAVAVRQGALHVRPRDRLLPGGQARAHRGPAPPGERPLAAVLRGLGRRGPPERVPAGGQRRALGRRRGARLRRRARTSSPHGGIGATWEHDAPLFFRRAQLSRRLLGGAGDATDRVAAELLAAA